MFSIVLPFYRCRKVRTLLWFRFGVHGLPNMLDASGEFPASSAAGVQHIWVGHDMSASAVGDEHHLVFQCEAHTPVRKRYPHLFSSSSRYLSQLIWQADLHPVVSFIYDAVQARRYVRRVRCLGGN